VFQAARLRQPASLILQTAGYRQASLNRSVAAKLRRAPLRIVTGAFILNSALSKLGADEKT
jgi:hypothetical protein